MSFTFKLVPDLSTNRRKFSSPPTSAGLADLRRLRAPDLTPSGRMLDEMRDKGEGFYQFARRLSHQHKRYFLERELAPEKVAAFDAAAARSLAEQERIEAEPQIDFDRFLADYQAQT